MITKGEQCSETVWGERVQSWQCQKRAVVVRDGKPYCKIHDPEYIVRKNAERQAEYEAKTEVRSARWKLELTAVNACKKINPDNPQAVAESIGDMYEALKVLLGIVAHNALPSEAKIRQAEKALSKADRK